MSKTVSDFVKTDIELGITKDYLINVSSTNLE